MQCTDPSACISARLNADNLIGSTSLRDSCGASLVKSSITRLTVQRHYYQASDVDFVQVPGVRFWRKCELRIQSF